MLTIDLLKGQETPVKSRPIRVALATAPLLVPTLAIAIMLSIYWSDKVILETTTTNLDSYSQKAQVYADVSQFLQQIEKEGQYIDKSLEEVSDVIGSHRQWSDVLQVLCKNLPDSLTLSRIEAKRNPVRKKVPKKDDPKKKVDLSGYQYTLHFVIDTGTDSAEELDIQQVIHRFSHAEELGEEIEDIKIASRKTCNEEDRTFVRYEIECVFKWNV